MPTGGEVIMHIKIDSKHFNGNKIIQNLHVELLVGQVTAILGPSGIGKSTLLHLLAGLDEDFEGKIDNASQRIGFCFQEPRLLPWLSVVDNLLLVEQQPAKIDRILAVMGLTENADTLCHHLSLGMARRVALARTLLVEPELMLLDEPFVSLDKNRSQQLLHLMIETIRQPHCATVLVTHEPQEAVALSDRIIVLGGTPATIVRDIGVNMTNTERYSVESVADYVETLLI